MLGAALAATLYAGALQSFALDLPFRPTSGGGAHILPLGNAPNAFRWRRGRTLPPPDGAGIVTDNTPPHGG